LINIKNITVTLISFFIFIMPVFSVEEITIDEKSNSMSEFSDFTGENFFKSAPTLNDERQKNIDEQRMEYNKKFRPYFTGSFDYSSKKTMPPLKKFRLKIAKFKNNKTDKNKDNSTYVDANGSIQEEVNEVANEEKSETQAFMKCKTVKYLPQTQEMEAVGNIEITFPKQGTIITADRMTYNQAGNIIQAFDNVKVIKGDKVVSGDYMKINMNEETSVIDNIKTSELNFTIHAENGYMFGDTILSTNGKISSEHDNILSLTSPGFGDEITKMIIPESDKTFIIKDIDSHKLVVKVSDINIKAKKSHDTIQLKNMKVYNKAGKKLVSLPSFTFYTNKEQDYFEGNFPELGSYPEFGMYAGPGLVLETPFGSTLKLMPIVAKRDKIGFGGIAKFKSGTNKTDVGYNTSSKHIMIKGRQRLDDYLTAQYGANSYMDEWFLGSSWLGYGGELVYERGYKADEFMLKNTNTFFTHRASAGMFQQNSRDKDNDKYRNDSHFKNFNAIGTARFKYMAEIRQNIYSYNRSHKYSKEDIVNNDLRNLELDIIGQTSSALYGTGDTQFIGRIGPRLTTQYKNWKQELGYFLSGYYDHSPLITMDAYRYGHSNIYLREYLRAHKYLTLGFYGSYKLSNDIEYDFQSTKNSKFREATFYVALGPDDFKLNLGWDIIRNSTYFGISMAMNTKGTDLEYDRLEIKNPDKLGKSDGEINTKEHTDFVSPPSPYRTKAIVTDIEDQTTIMNGENL